LPHSNLKNALAIIIVLFKIKFRLLWIVFKVKNGVERRGEN
jgi:hypothetical protein